MSNWTHWRPHPVGPNLQIVDGNADGRKLLESLRPPLTEARWGWQMILRSQSRGGPLGEVEERRYFGILHLNVIEKLSRAWSVILDYSPWESYKVRKPFFSYIWLLECRWWSLGRTGFWRGRSSWPCRSFLRMLSEVLSRCRLNEVLSLTHELLFHCNKKRGEAFR